MRPIFVDGAAARQRPIQVIALILLALLVWVLSPVLTPLLAAGFAVLVAYGSFDRLVVTLRGRRSLAAALATVILILTVFVPVGGALYAAGVQLVAAGHALARVGASAGGVNELVAQLPPFMRDRMPALSETAVSAVAAWAGRAASWAPGAVRSIGWFVAEALLGIVSAYYLFLDGPIFVSFLRDVSPLDPRQTDALLKEFREVAIGLFRGNVVVALFHGASAAIGYWIFGTGHVFLFGALTAIASFVPLLGTSLVWAPLVAGLAIGHHTGRAIGLLIWCLVVVGMSDNFIRPLVSRGHMALPRLLLFLTLFGGLELLGPKGLLLGPLVGSLAVTALRLLQREQPPEEVEDPAPTPD